VSNIKLIKGDCLQKMKDIPDKSKDMIFCDLPYGTTRCKWDTVINLDLLWEQYCRIIKDNGAILLFAQTPFDKVLGVSNLQMLKYEWIWEKTSATGHLNAKKMPMKAHENILVFYKKPPTYNPQMTTGHTPIHSFNKKIEVQNHSEIYGNATKEIIGGGSTIRYPRSVQVFSSDKQTSALHPTQKPVGLLEYFIKTYTNKGDEVLDNCMGVASTGIACLETNRNFEGIELETDYFETCKNRVNTYIKENNLQDIHIEIAE